MGAGAPKNLLSFSMCRGFVSPADTEVHRYSKPLHKVVRSMQTASPLHQKTPKHGPRTLQVFTEKYLHRNGPTYFKPMLFKIQLYLHFWGQKYTEKRLRETMKNVKCLPVISKFFIINTFKIRNKHKSFLLYSVKMSCFSFDNNPKMNTEQ